MLQLNLIADKDECRELGNGGCSMICRNTIGSYECACYSGFTLMPNNHTCESKSRAIFFYLNAQQCNVIADNVKLKAMIQIKGPPVWLPRCQIITTYLNIHFIPLFYVLIFQTSVDINECCTGNGNNAPVKCQGVRGAFPDNANNCNETIEECVDTSGSYTAGVKMAIIIQTQLRRPVKVGFLKYIDLIISKGQ